MCSEMNAIYKFGFSASSQNNLVFQIIINELFNYYFVSAMLQI